MIELEDMRVLVVGLGSSGEATTEVLLKLGSHPVLVDSSASPSRAEAAEALRAAGADVRLEVSVPEDLSSFGLVVASPGVPDRAPVLTEARALGKKVISELELGYRLTEGATVVAVTGTNGKTTTTELTASILDRPGRRAFACGNIGRPLVSLHGVAREEDVLVCEVSSFQLQNIELFRPNVAVALNLAPDHFDWHADMDEYASAKARMVENMTGDDTLVFNADDEFCARLAAGAQSLAVGFSRSGTGGALAVSEGAIVTGPPLEPGTLVELRDLSLVGAHNLDNVMAAAGVALILGEDRERVRSAVAGFKGLEHRCEPAGEVGGITFYNDSKATNPHASLQAVASFDRPFVVIAGGRNKGLEFSGLAGTLCRRMEDGTLAGIVLMGESASEINDAVTDACPSLAAHNIARAGDMLEAVRKAYEMTPEGGAVLFSPACASFDMYSDYKDRGRAFKAAVSGLAGGAGNGGIE